MPKPNERETVQTLVIARLRERRMKIGLSMNGLAEKSGLALTTISFFERELRKPTLDTLIRIADALEIELWKILKLSTDEAKGQKRH